MAERAEHSDQHGGVLALALYGPYGVGRYATGTMPSSKGYTGQRQDSGSGLDYYNARYYDPALAQFASADTVQGPNRYGYVGVYYEASSVTTDPCSRWKSEGGWKEGAKRWRCSPTRRLRDSV